MIVTYEPDPQSEYGRTRPVILTDEQGRRHRLTRSEARHLAIALLNRAERDAAYMETST